MTTSRPLAIIRGGGDLATGVAYRLHQAGFPLIILELAQPLVVRRRVALATAVLEGEVTVEGLRGRLVVGADGSPAQKPSLAEALAVALSGELPVVVAPVLPDFPWPVPILIDARLAKRNIDTTTDQASLVIALGPGFTAGQDCHAVIETMRGHRLGRVIWQGSALPNTGTPGVVAGKGAERVLRAPVAGEANWNVEIGDLVAAGQIIGAVAGRPVVAPFDGVVRGLIAKGTYVPAGLKIGDLDGRGDVSACFTISDKALAVGGGVLEAILANSAHQGARSASHLAWPGTGAMAGSTFPSLSLPAAFRLEKPGELVALTGGGGKSSLMFALASALPGKVVTTTTTRIFTAQTKLAPAVCWLAEGESDARAVGQKPANGNGHGLAELGMNLARFGSCLVLGAVSGEKATGVPLDLPEMLLARADVDFVIVEADGSRMRPCKAPAEHEPAIPGGATLVVPVAGIDAVGGQLAAVAHRPERVSQLLGLALDDIVTPAALATLITHPLGGLKNVPPAARVIPFVNKVETESQLQAARQVARQLLHEPKVEQVVLGALQSAQPVREIHRRVTAIVLAAGQSRRMSQSKQLLPWGNDTVLATTLRNVVATAVYDVLLVTGDAAETVEAIARASGVPAIFNPDYANGEMLSSLQVALRQAPLNCAAVLVVLADQPMIKAGTMDQLLVAYWQGKGELIAPVYLGQRGNPVLIGRKYFQELLAMPAVGRAAPRDLLQRHLSDLVLVRVATDTILRDLDTPDDYERWRPRIIPAAEV